MGIALAGGITQVLDVRDASQVGAARRAAATLAERAGLGANHASDLAILVTELGNNLVKHATRGQLLLDVHDGEVEVLSIDSGPGMDLEHCFRDGYSTSGTPGTGLGAVRRIARQFDAHADERGSVLFAGVGARRAPSTLAAIRVPIAGEWVCGDQWNAFPGDDGFSLALCDGLGHGPLALQAAERALEALAQAPEDPARALQLAHERSFGTRGSACAMVHWQASGNRLAMSGVGNIATSVIGRDGSRGLASQSGTLGAVCPRVQGNAMESGAGSLLVMHSDGLSARWSLDAYPGLRVRHPKVVAGVLYRDAGRQRDDATVVVARL